MKKIALLFFGFVFVFTSCTSSKKNLQKGNYDAIITHSIKKLIKNPEANKQAVLLDKAFLLANERDLEAINYLKLEGQAGSWEKIFQHYDRLKQRQNQLKKILPFKLNGQLINYKQVDYDAEIVTAKRKAAAYFYANGKRLLEAQEKGLIRQAYYELQKAKSYSGSSYADINALIEEAKSRGISRVFVSIENSSLFNFPPSFMEQLLSGNISKLNSDWVQYWFYQADNTIAFDYEAVVRIRQIQVSPDDIKTVDHVYKKRVADGFDYVYDSRGNVKKDSLGNDIKKIKYADLQCALVETIQHKSARLEGDIQFYELYPDERLIGQKPFGIENTFHHVSARAIGDTRALDKEALEQIKQKVIPFPPDEALIFENAVRVQEAIYQLLRSNASYFN